MGLVRFAVLAQIQTEAVVCRRQRATVAGTIRKIVDDSLMEGDGLVEVRARLGCVRENRREVDAADGEILPGAGRVSTLLDELFVDVDGALVAIAGLVNAVALPQQGAEVVVVQRQITAQVETFGE